MSITNTFPDHGEIVLFQDSVRPNFQIEVRVENETIWLSQKQMSELFECSIDNIALHLKNIYKEQELSEISTSEEYSVVQKEGGRNVKRKLLFYNLDAIISTGYRVNSIRGIQAYARNKLIAEAFYLTGDIEKYGTGFKRIYNELKQYPSMQLDCKEIPNGFFVELSYTKQKTILNSKVTDKVTDNLPENQMQILRMIRKNAFFTTKELADKIKISQRKIKENMGKLKKKGLIKRIAPPKGGHWEIIKEKTK